MEDKKKQESQGFGNTLLFFLAMPVVAAVLAGILGGLYSILVPGAGTPIFKSFFGHSTAKKMAVAFPLMGWGGIMYFFSRKLWVQVISLVMALMGAVIIVSELVSKVGQP